MLIDFFLQTLFNGDPVLQVAGVEAERMLSFGYLACRILRMPRVSVWQRVALADNFKNRK